ncbi:MAG TPA: energy transducer TonB [Burkholderiales bacterium]|nr:energy transducer TonB [Burkholderiales bacterium]
MDDSRAFHYALATSLALHALLLVAFPDLADTARRAASIPPQIIARLMEPEPAPPVPVPAPPVQTPTPPVPPEKKKAPAAKKPAPVISTPHPAPTPSVPAVADPVPAPPPPPLAAMDPKPPTPAAAPQPAQPPESLSRDQYRLQLIDEARRHKRYPPLARENNWQGDVRVDVAISANGRPTVTLKGSSGYEVLDRQALDMFAQAARSIPVPPALRGKEFSFEVRAVYGLED